MGGGKKEIRGIKKKFTDDSQRSRLEIIRQGLKHGCSDKHAKAWIFV